MSENEILELWRSGIDKIRLAELYKRRHNQQVKVIRASMRHRHDRQIHIKLWGSSNCRKNNIQKYYEKESEVQMNREDLQEYKYNREFIKEKFEYIDELKETICKVTATISDMPKRN